MNVQDEIKEMKQRIAELEELAKVEQEFPQEGDTYFSIDNMGCIDVTRFAGRLGDGGRLAIGNLFKTREETKFAIEKLKVEAELRKFSRPFKDDENNCFIELNWERMSLSLDSYDTYQTQGTIYFESVKKASEAIDSVGEERIKKYIFNVE